MGISIAYVDPNTKEIVGPTNERTYAYLDAYRRGDVAGMRAAQQAIAEYNATPGGRYASLGPAVRIGAGVLIGSAASAGITSAFATTGASTSTVASTGANAVDFPVDEFTGFSQFPDISPDLIDTPYTPFSTNPTIADLEMGGSGAGLPGMTPNVSNYPSLNQISTGAKAIADLYVASKVADARVAQARAAATPVTTTPNWRNFLSNPGGMLSPTGSGAVSKNIPTIAIVGLVLLFVVFLFKKG